MNRICVAKIRRTGQWYELDTLILQTVELCFLHATEYAVLAAVEVVVQVDLRRIGFVEQLDKLSKDRWINPITVHLQIYFRRATFERKRNPGPALFAIHVVLD